LEECFSSIASLIEAVDIMSATAPGSYILVGIHAEDEITACCLPGFYGRMEICQELFSWIYHLIGVFDTKVPLVLFPDSAFAAGTKGLVGCDDTDGPAGLAL
jgi:hypothetical protein